MWSDLRLASRTLVRSPLFAVTTVAALALGIGANTAIFSVINALLLHPAGIPHPDRLMAIRVKYDKLNLKSIAISAPDFADVRDSKQIFAAASLEQDGTFNYTSGDVPERLLGAQVSWQWFDVFGDRPSLGRGFRPEEDQPTANHVVVLGYGTWQRVFGGDAAIVGKTILLNQQGYRVVGVMGREFNWPSEAQLWVPIGLPPGEFAADNRFNEGFRAVAAVQPGVSVAQAESYVLLLTRQLIDSHHNEPYYRDSGWGIFVLPLAEFVYGDLRSPLLVLLGAVGFVLLIACSNVAGLMLARETGRARELAVRAALGAGRWPLIRQTLAEGLLLAAAGTVLGLGVAALGVRLLVRLAPVDIAAGVVIQLDHYVLLFTAAVGVLAGLVAAIAPALRLSGAHNFELLKEGGRSGTASRGRLRVRAVLVTGQVALALVLLVGAGLFMTSLGRMEQLSPGFDARGVMTGFLSPENQYRQEDRLLAFYRAVVEKAANLPGVQSAAAVYPLPFSGDAASSSFEIQGRVLAPGDPGPHSDLFAVTPGYFTALRIPLLEGRTFTERDREGGQAVVMIDENLARRYWPGQDPVGKQVRRGQNSSWATIVGVVAHVHHSVLAGDTGKGACYYPLLQVPVPMVYLVAKTAADPTRLAGPLRDAVRSVDAGQPFSDPTPLEALVASSLAPRRFAVTLLGFFAAVALALAALGLYGVISYAVTERTQEIGIRMALGARRWQVLGMIVRQGLWLAAGGIMIGLVAAFFLGRLVASQLFEVSAFDPVTLASMALLLVAVALTASYLPARRASWVDPMVALRYE